jgi:ribosomal protein S18 acetylase RimI-like enzyme
MRETLLSKYERLDPAPPIAEQVRTELGEVDQRSHDHVDHLMLSAVVANAVKFLVTDDGDILRKASRLGLGDRVFSVEDALALLQSLQGTTPQPPPAVQATKAYVLDEQDPIFDTFREDYPGFNEWLVRCKLDQRPTWIIRDADDQPLSGVCIVKTHDDELHLGGSTLKVCSLKVSQERQGRRYGELLLKTLFQYLAENGYDFAFLTVFDRHAGLISLLEDFGFDRHTPDTPLGERVYVKALRPSAQQRDQMTALEFHIRFGPPALKLVAEQAFVVPIQPHFHALLFPDAQRDSAQQLELDLGISSTSPRPFGNAIRKAYLSNSPSRQLRAGATILFYRSRAEQAVTSIGVVEDTLVSQDASYLLSFAGQRTVYSFQEIESLCSHGEVVAMLFRQDRLLPTPIPRDELVSQGVVRRAPQSIARVPPEVIPWLTARLGG